MPAGFLRAPVSAPNFLGQLGSGTISRVNRFSFSLVGLLIAAGSAVAIGETETLTPSRTANEHPDVLIKRILESRRSKEAKLAAIAQFVKLGDLVDGLENRLGKPKKLERHANNDCALFYETGLGVISRDHEVIAIFFLTHSGQIVPLNQPAR
jgi:hypothetical protein